MSRQGFRFVHATCLCLDEPLVGTGTLSREDRELAEDATFLTWDGIVQTCLASQCEFLLLTGNSFDASVNSLRARVALERGFEKLAAHEISVFIAPGSRDPAGAWRRRFSLPPNVTVLADEDQDPVAVVRDQRTIASVYLVATAQSDEANWNASGPAALQRNQGPFQIGLVPAGTPIHWESGRPVPIQQTGVTSTAAALVKAAIEHQVDYLALGEGVPRTEHFASGIAHDPGCAQSLSAAISGSRGCSVVNVATDRTVTIDPVAVAPIRWETVQLNVDRSTNWNDLAERMALAMMERIADNDERLWIATWRLTGEGTVFESLADRSAQDKLWAQVEAELEGETEVRRAHRLERVVFRDPEAQEPDERPATGLLADFEELLDTDPDGHFELVQRELLSRDWMSLPEMAPLRQAVQRLSRERVQRRAKSLAAHWLD